MILIIIFCGLLVIGILMWVIGILKDCFAVEGVGIAFFVLSLAFGLTVAVLLPAIYATYEKTISAFQSQKHYIEKVVPALPATDNYAITQKRIELNQWLYEAQCSYEHYRLVVFIPKEVMELEEIR